MGLITGTEHWQGTELGVPLGTHPHTVGAEMPPILQAELLLQQMSRGGRMDFAFWSLREDAAETLQGPEPRAKADWKIFAVASNYKGATENFIARFQESFSCQKCTKPRGSAQGYIRSEESCPPLHYLETEGAQSFKETQPLGVARRYLGQGEHCRADAALRITRGTSIPQH